MKKLLATLILALFATSALADGHRGYEHHGGSNWIAPMFIGGVVGYVIAQPRIVYVQQPQVVYQPVVTVLAPAPFGYHYESIVDAACNCYRTVLVSN